MTRLLLLLVLSVFVYDVVSVEIWADNHVLNTLEMPFDAEEEEEKSEKEKELFDRLFSADYHPGRMNSRDLRFFVYHNDYATIPREIVTPPPDHKQS